MTRLPFDELHVPKDDPRVQQFAEELLGGKEEYALRLAQSHFTAFERTGNGLDAMRAFAICHQARIFPEQKFLDWLNDGFEQWCAAKGNKSLDVILGLQPGERLKRNPLRSELLVTRDSILIEEVAKLTSLSRKPSLKVTVFDAAQMVSERLKHTAWDRTGFNIKELAADKLRNSYFSAEWHFRRSEAEAFFRSVVSAYTVEEIRVYLSNFPPHSFPPRLKKVYF